MDASLQKAPANALHCGRRPPFWIKRLLPGSLLALLLFRLLVLPHGHALTPRVVLAALAAAFLGGCLWWVAQRQSTPAGAALALALYASSLTTRLNLLAFLPALGLFAMLYTGVGVAHALAGPRRKWAPRIVLMALLSAFSAWAQPLACTAGLLLSLAVCLYLLEKPLHRLLLPLFALWSVCGAVAGLHAFNRLPLAVRLPWSACVPLATALAAALGLWLFSPRSRFFGHTAPLIAAAALACLALLIGPEALTWALAPAVVFVAGVFTDGFASPYRRAWLAGALILALAQIGLGR